MNEVCHIPIILGLDLTLARQVSVGESQTPLGILLASWQNFHPADPSW